MLPHAASRASLILIQMDVPGIAVEKWKPTYLECSMSNHPDDSCLLYALTTHLLHHDSILIPKLDCNQFSEARRYRRVPSQVKPSSIVCLTPQREDDAELD
jgi:hypothetical protein